jgi:apolipoprotein N-acyltransferase
MVQLTNDAWFGEVSGPYQHLAQARVRAIEQGLPLARAANTGVSAMIDPLGRVLARAELGGAGVVDAELPAPLPPTPYARFGDLPWVLAVLALFGLTYVKLNGGFFHRTRR